MAEYKADSMKCRPSPNLQNEGNVDPFDFLCRKLNFIDKLHEKRQTRTRSAGAASNQRTFVFGFRFGITVTLHMSMKEIENSA